MTYPFRNLMLEMEGVTSLQLGLGFDIMSGNRLVSAIQSKFHEAVERTQHLITLIPEDRLHWRPTGPEESYSDIGHLLGHLLCTMGGFCAVMQRAFPEKLGHFEELRTIEINHFCPPEEAIERIRFFAEHVDEGFRECTDKDLERILPTIFVPAGEPMLTLLLNNLEHLINHKYQLFFYLKLLGVKVGTEDIYHFR